MKIYLKKEEINTILILLMKQMRKQEEFKKQLEERKEDSSYVSKYIEHLNIIAKKLI